MGTRVSVHSPREDGTIFTKRIYSPVAVRSFPKNLPGPSGAVELDTRRTLRLTVDTIKYSPATQGRISHTAGSHAYAPVAVEKRDPDHVSGAAARARRRSPRFVTIPFDFASRASRHGRVMSLFLLVAYFSVI